MVKLPKMEGEKTLVLLPNRWVIERSFARLNRFRRRARDNERLAEHLAGYHWVAAILLALNSLLPYSSKQALMSHQATPVPASHGNTNPTTFSMIRYWAS